MNLMRHREVLLKKLRQEADEVLEKKKIEC